MKYHFSPRQAGKQTRLLSEYIAKVVQGKRAMILGHDYVVMSRNIYEAWVEKMKVEGFDMGHFDDLIDLDKDEEVKGREWEEQELKHGGKHEKIN